MRRLRPPEVKDMLAEPAPAPLLLDVREPWEFEKVHIADSIHVPMNQIPQSLERLAEHEEIVVICHHGMRSLQVGQFLEQQGHPGIINLEGGIDAWAREIDNSLPTY